MAIDPTKIIISAEDRTRQAFDSVRGGLTAITGLAAALGAGVLANTVKEAAKFNDEMDEMAQKLGLNLTSLSELKYAADLSGDSFDALQTGIKKLTSNMGDLANGGKEAKELFSSVGIEALDSSGKLRDADEVLKDIADLFQRLPDGAQKTALAIKFFGKSGADLIPMLNEGSAGLERFADEARKLGVVVSDDMARASAQFNDNIDRLGKVADGIKLSIGNRLIPALAELSDELVETTKESNLLYAALKGIYDLGGIIVFGTEQTQRAERMAELVKQIAMAEKQLNAGSLNPTPNGFVQKYLIPDVKLSEEGRNSIRKNLYGMTLELRDLARKQFEDIKIPSPMVDIEKSVSGGKKAKDGNSVWAKEMQELAAFMQTLQKASEGPLKQSEDLQRQLDAYRALNPEVQNYLQGLVDQVKAREDLVEANAEYDKQQKAMAEFEDMQIQQERRILEAEMQREESMRDQAKAIREMLDPSLKLIELQQQYTELLDAGLISQDEYTKALKIATDEQEKLVANGVSAYEELRREIEGFSKSAGDALTDFFFTGEVGFTDMVNSMLKDLARMAVKRNITDPLFDAFADSGILKDFSSIFSGMFGGARATGGPVASGKAYLVGERGPELFMPGASGTIIPNDFGGGGSVNVTVNIDASGTKIQGDNAQAEAVARMVGDLVRGELVRQKRPGGALA
jgi:hypothetical protein